MSRSSSSSNPPRLQTLLQIVPSAPAPPDSPKKSTASTSNNSNSNSNSSTSHVSKQPRRSISFASQLAHVVCYIETREEVATEDLYFTRADYHLSRSAAKLTSREAERHGYSKNLVDAYSGGKTAENQDRLNLWCVHGHSRRGLERWANTKHGEERQQDQFQATMAVLRAQDDMLAKSATVDCEKLRKVSHKATKTSRHFARMMGKADSFAMAQQLQQEQLEENGEVGVDESLRTRDDELSVARTLDDTLLDMTADSASVTSYDTISMPGGELKDTMHGADDNNSSNNGGSQQFIMGQRFKRFGFGRSSNKSTNKAQVEERVSRVA